MGFEVLKVCNCNELSGGRTRYNRITVYLINDRNEIDRLF